MPRIRVRSSSSRHIYDLVFKRSRGPLRFSCSCPDGSLKQFCKHRRAILDGDIRSVVSSDIAFSEIHKAFASSAAATVMIEMTALEREMARTKTRISALKKQLGRMLG
jgi:hypothetical protein